MNNDEKRDLDQALALIKDTGCCSAAMLQRRMAIGYNYATKLMRKCMRIHRNLQSRENTSVFLEGIDGGVQVNPY